MQKNRENRRKTSQRSGLHTKVDRNGQTTNVRQAGPTKDDEERPIP